MVLSHIIDNDSPVYGNKKDQISIVNSSCLSEGDSSNSLFINISNHIGTHIDFPKHFCQKGKTLNNYSDDFWLFNNIGFIESSFEQLASKLDFLDCNIEILIVKTGFEKYRGTKKYIMEQPVVNPILANILRAKFKNLRVLGFDMLSISSYLDRQIGREAHKEFLCKNNILLLEDMKLDKLNSKPNKILIGPLLINEADGVPCFVYAT